MEPMQPMEPMSGSEAWWPEDLGEPTTRGGQNGLRYAFFPDRKRLLVERDGATTAYDTGDRDVRGVQQQNGGEPVFTTGEGSIGLADLDKAPS